MTPFKFIMVYIHRYLRLTPLYAFVLFLTWSMQPYVGPDGPLWYKANDINADCKDYWWSNLLYINNFVPDYKGSYCIGVAWYLANDMQFFLISPIILYAYHRLRISGWLNITLLALLGILVPGLIANYFDLKVVTFAASNKSNWFQYYYIKPYCRVSPYALGLAVGVIIYTFRLHKSEGKVYDRISLAISTAY